MPVAVPLEKFGLINDAVDPAVRVFSDAPHEESGFSQTVPERDVSPKQDFYFSGYQSELSLASADVEGVDQAETWMTGYTPVKLVGIGAGYFIQWYDASRLRIREAMPIDEARITRGEYMMTKDGGDREGHGVYLSRNGLTHINPTDGGWADNDNDDIPDGYSTDGTKSEAFTNGVYEAFVDTSVSSDLGVGPSGNIPFPVGGAELTFSAEFVQLHDDGDTSLKLVTLDASETAINFATPNVTSTGRFSFTRTIDENTHFIRLRIEVSNATAENAKLKVKDPCLRVDGSDQYVPK